MLEAVGWGIVSGLITSAISRISNVELSKLARLKRIDSALRSNSPPDNPELDKVLDDLKTVLGSYQGKLDQPLNQFIEEIRQSGLATRMLEFALTQRNDLSPETYFLELHNLHFGNSGEPTQLFNGIIQSFRHTVDGLIHDKYLYKAISTHLHSIDQRIDYLVNKDSLSQEDINTTLSLICRNLRNKYKHISIETNKGSKRVDISRIYTPSTITSNEKIARDRFLKEIAQQSGKKINLRNELFSEIIKSDAVDYKFQEFKSSFNRAVILGDPGGGKSTICQQLCYEMAKAQVSYLDFRETGEKRFDYSTLRIPLKVTLRSYEAAKHKDPQIDLLTYIVRDTKNHCTSESIDNIQCAILHALTFGRALIVFDGLDEILAVSRRREFVDLVSSFSHQYPLCQVLVTSRLVGYRDAKLPDDFTEYRLQHFDNEEIVDYVTKFMTVVAGTNKKESGKKAESFLKQTNNHASDIRKNPLMLGLMSSIFNIKGDVPSNRPEIYKHCATLMFEKWDQDRDIRAEIPDDFDLLDLFSDIAYQLFDDDETNKEYEVDREWLKKQITNYFRTLYESESKAISASRNLVAFVTGRAWVMAEFGDNAYRFTHQTFLEYFFARHLDGKFDTIKQLFSVIRPKIRQRKWEVVAPLSLQLKSFRNHRKIKEALDECQKMVLTKTKSKRSKSAEITFIAEALTFLPGAERDTRSLYRSALEKSIELYWEPNENSYESISLCFSRCKERKDILLDELRKFTISKIKSSDEQISLAAVDLLIDHWINFAQEGSISERLKAEDSALSEQLKKDCKNIIFEKAKESRIFAFIYIQTYGDKFAQLIDIYGARSMFLDKESTRPKSIGNIDHFNASLLTSLLSTASEALEKSSFLMKSFGNWVKRNPDNFIDQMRHYSTTLRYPPQIINESFEILKIHEKLSYGFFAVFDIVYSTMPTAKEDKEELEKIEQKIFSYGLKEFGYDRQFD